jgi:hypothetical protein
MQNLQLYNDKDYPTVFLTYCQPYEMGNIKVIMDKFGYLSGHPIFFYKVGQNAGGLKQFIYAVDCAFVAYRPARDKVQWLGPQNPLQRHNIIFVPNMKDKRLVDADGELVNKTEKHPLCTRTICARFCKQGDNVLVLGSGAGGDVEGALGAGCNVVAIEKNAFQFTQCNQRVFRLFHEDIDKILKLPSLHGDDDDNKDSGYNMMGLASKFGPQDTGDADADDDDNVAQKLDFKEEPAAGQPTCGICMDVFSKADSKMCGNASCDTMLHDQKTCLKFTCDKCDLSFCIRNHLTLHMCQKGREKAPDAPKSDKKDDPDTPKSSVSPGSAATQKGHAICYYSIMNLFLC